MPEVQTDDFIGKVTPVRVDEITPSKNNPRGTVEKNESFERLVASINKVGVLVPLVLTPARAANATTKYELVDGERRYWAAKELGREMVPAHILHGPNIPNDLRKLMFHLHMTREQWGPMAQCRALVDTYQSLRHGITFEEKEKWAKKLSIQTGMSPNTARDRVHILAWSEKLKDEVFRYDEAQPTRNIYSYALAIEASVIEPSFRAFPSYFDHGQDPTAVANRTREFLFRKTVQGLDYGLIRSREQIRAVFPIFSPTLEGEKKKTALRIFRHLVETPDLQFDDIHAELSSELPELLEEKPPKPQRVISSMKALQRVFSAYDPSYFEAAAKTDPARKKIKTEFFDAAMALVSSIDAALKRVK